MALFYFLNQYYQYVFYNLNNKFSWFYNDGNIILKTYFNVLIFIKWFFLNSNFNNLLEILSVNDFLNDRLMWLYILTISTYLAKSFSLGLILINLQSRYFPSAFCLSISLYLVLYLCPFSSILWLIYESENTSQLYTLKQCCSNIFLLPNTLSTFVCIDCSCLIIGPYGLNPNLVLNSNDVGTVEYIVILKARTSRMYIPV